MRTVPHFINGERVEEEGRSHVYGPEGFAYCTRAMVVTTRWPRASESPIDLGFATTR